jgi:hypothetical protein
MTIRFDKTALDYQNLCEVEKIRKKLNTNGREYEKYIAVQDGTIYSTNGFYMVAVKAESIEDGVYQVVKNKGEVILIPSTDISFPKCTEIEQLCPEYGCYEAFKATNSTEKNSAINYCQIIRALESDIIDIDLFAPIHATGFFSYFRICEKDAKRPVFLCDSETEPTKRAYIMGMIF